MMHRIDFRLKVYRRVVLSYNLWKVVIIVWWVFMKSVFPVHADSASGADQDVARGMLKNGLKVIVVRNPIAPVVSTVINYHVGSNEAPKGFPGMAHAGEHMMFRGSPGLSAEQLADINAALGGMFNAETRQTVTQYYYTVPAEYLDVVLRIEAARMCGIDDNERRWHQEREALKQEVAGDLSIPEYIYYTRLLATLFKGTPYAHDALGTTASFDATSSTMLKKFHEAWYVPNNATLVIAGDVEPSAVLSRVAQYFDFIPARELPPRLKIVLEPFKPEIIRLTTGLPYSLATLTFRMPGYDSADYAAALVLADVLNSQRGELFNLAAEGKILEAEFEFSPLFGAGMGSVAAAFTPGKNPENILGMMRGVLSQLNKEGIPSELIEAAKRHQIAGAEFKKNSIFETAMSWSEAVAVEGLPSPRDMVAAVKAVTVDDVNRVFRRYVDPANAVVAVLTPRSSGKPVSTRSSQEKERLSFPRNREVVLPPWASEALERRVVPTANPGVVQKTLLNGITLVVQPTSVSSTVSLFGHVKHNPALQVPKGKEGIAEVLESLFKYGTERLDRQAFQKALDEIAADVSAGTDFSLGVLKEHFDSGAGLLAENLLHPAMPGDAFEIVVEQTARIAAANDQNPADLAHRTLMKSLLPKHDPALRRVTPKSVSSLTRDDVRAYHETIMRPDETIIVVIGDITPGEAETVISRYFGEWKAIGPKPDLLLPPIPHNRPNEVHVPSGSRVQDEVVLAGTMGLTRFDPDYYSLQLGNCVLGGGFYATRLYRELREEKGLVYSVEVDMDVDQRRALYSVEYACDPGNVKKVETIVRRNIDRMRHQLVAASELNLAKAMLLREVTLAESSLESIAHGFIHRFELDLPLDEHLLAARRYEALTAEDVKAAFTRWVHPDNWVRVAQGPSPR